MVGGIGTRIRLISPQMARHFTKARDIISYYLPSSSTTTLYGYRLSQPVLLYSSLIGHVRTDSEGCAVSALTSPPHPINLLSSPTPLLTHVQSTMAPDLNSVPPSPRNPQTCLSQPSSNVSSRRPSHTMTPGTTTFTFHSEPGMPERHPRPLTAAELHLQLEKEQEAVVRPSSYTTSPPPHAQQTLICIRTSRSTASPANSPSSEPSTPPQ